MGIWGPTWRNGVDTYDAENGTSFSSPLVAATAALMFSVNPNLSNQQIRDLLLNSADDVGTPGWDEHYGNGRLNVLRAVQFAQDPGSHQARASVSLNPSRITAGSAISVNGSGFNAGESIEVYFVYADGHRKDLSNVTADAGGNFNLNATLPNDAPPSDTEEEYAVRAYGSGSHRDAAAKIFIQNGPPVGGQPTPTQPAPVTTPGPAATPTCTRGASHSSRPLATPCASHSSATGSSTVAWPSSATP